MSTSTVAISDLHHDILQAHVLTCLDGPTLASTAAASRQLRSLSCDPSLWTKLCRDTWPSTEAPRVQEVIRSLPDTHRSFFADSFPLPTSTAVRVDRDDHRVDQISELISAVDLRFNGEVIFSKVVETETLSGWFLHSPFRVDLLHRKEVVPTEVDFRREKEDTCRDLAAGLELSWVLIDPAAGRAVSLSSLRAVSVSPHEFNGNVHVRFAAVLAGHVQCGVLVTCGGSRAGTMHVREICLVAEDLEGTHLKGRDSLVILRRALEGKRGKGFCREVEAKRRYEEFLERQRKRREAKLRNEGVLDIFSSFAMATFVISALAWAIFAR